MLDSYRTGNGFPRGQSYGQILRNAKAEELALVDAIGVRTERIANQKTLTTDNGVLGLESGDNLIGDSADSPYLVPEADPFGLG